MAALATAADSFMASSAEISPFSARRACSFRAASTSLYLSKYHICHIFQENLHTSFHQYITDLRVEKAKDLLAGTEDSIADISAQAGFGTIRGLNRQFLSKTGMTPTEYRRKKQK